jgi:hypothetical protein
MFRFHRFTAAVVLSGMMVALPGGAMAMPVAAASFQIAEGQGIPADAWTAKASKPIRAELAQLLKKKLGNVPMKFGFTTDDVREAWHNQGERRYRTVGVWVAYNVEQDGEKKGLVDYFNLMADKRGDGKFGKWYLDNEYQTPGDSYYIDSALIK